MLCPEQRGHLLDCLRLSEVGVEGVAWAFLFASFVLVWYRYFTLAQSVSESKKKQKKTSFGQKSNEKRERNGKEITNTRFLYTTD